MSGSIVLPLPTSTSDRRAEPTSHSPETALLQDSEEIDPLSQVLALMKPRLNGAGAFGANGDMSVSFPRHEGIKCYAMLAGECWLVVEGQPEPLRLRAGDCFLLPRGLPFCLTSDLSLPPVSFLEWKARLILAAERGEEPADAHCIAGGHFLLTGTHRDMLLQALPPIVHIRRDADKDAMRWCIERMRQELRHPQPGGSLLTQQLAYTLLIQALRLHLADGPHDHGSWLSALADPQMSLAIAQMHNQPAYPWTLESLAARIGMSRSVFALRFRQVVGITPIEYLTRWRMLLAADRLQNSHDGLSTIATSLGYQSESAFGKAFRRVMGHSPRRQARSSAASQ